METPGETPRAANVRGRGLALVLAGFLGLSPLGVSAASFEGLGSLPGAVPGSEASAVSADGTAVVGDCATAASCSEGWRWTPATGMVGLGFPAGGTTSAATDVSADGTRLVGSGLIGGSQALFRWSLGGSFETIEPPFHAVYPELSRSVVAISADGEVVLGYQRLDYWPDPSPSVDVQVSRYWTWSSSAGVSILMSGATPPGSERVSGLSGDGIRASGTHGPVDEYDAIRLDGDERHPLALLNYLPPPNDALCVNFWCTGSGEAIDTTGIVVGESVAQAALWPLAGGVTGMGFLSGESSSVATDVSTGGSRAIGLSPMPAYGTPRPFFWSVETGMLEFEDVLVQAGLDFSGWTLTSVTALSDDGTTVVGTGVNPSGQSEAWRVVLPDLATLSLPAQAPIVHQPAMQVGLEGELANFALAASDPNGDSLVFSASGLPTGLSMGPGTGLVTGTPAPGSAAGSPYAVAVQVSDGANTTYVVFQWTLVSAAGVPALFPGSVLVLVVSLAGVAVRGLRRRTPPL